jgi:hypothetical protein
MPQLFTLRAETKMLFASHFEIRYISTGHRPVIREKCIKIIMVKKLISFNYISVSAFFFIVLFFSVW